VRRPIHRAGAAIARAPGEPGFPTLAIGAAFFIRRTSEGGSGYSCNPDEGGQHQAQGGLTAFPPAPPIPRCRQSSLLGNRPRAPLAGNDNGAGILPSTGMARPSRVHARGCRSPRRGARGGDGCGLDQRGDSSTAPRPPRGSWRASAGLLMTRSSLARPHRGCCGGAR
jgi:hypothetical protein